METEKTGEKNCIFFGCLAKCFIFFSMSVFLFVEESSSNVIGEKLLYKAIIRETREELVDSSSEDECNTELDKIFSDVEKEVSKQTKRYKRRREKKLQALQDEVIITHDKRSDSPAKKQSDGINTEFPEKVITENVTTFQCNECDANYTR
ncbi:uncharacterized protein LOC130629965 [Hydractinia symbiolongicarpus]|uniref:uncharacterized protein LOC130629965 n=1 Tax=Hydractinia symbiolongicarpus TaxID=13093 RepID=UPI0025513F93|nr:uncharacterized protein LOC130629965 [Hydractinia symbiolongicarpus]